MNSHCCTVNQVPVGHLAVPRCLTLLKMARRSTENTLSLLFQSSGYRGLGSTTGLLESSSSSRMVGGLALGANIVDKGVDFGSRVA